MLKMSKDILLSDDDLTSLLLVVSLELIADIRTDDLVLVDVEVLQKEDLPVLQIFQAVSSDESYPVVVDFC